ncbi:hypothetical protein GM418_05885 [Maribellus comscasis]|uniref:Uncharacterized protein n=1 Tax=Maribellus comscasis TaxID=2681766 RepID=A0A6I6JK26_9BACT|nr:hypothetical protein [Maribellus comscasis]QGY43206.1 hypothetical protein GM418_05885 [Maribellus comscasis]
MKMLIYTCDAAGIRRSGISGLAYLPFMWLKLKMREFYRASSRQIISM